MFNSVSYRQKWAEVQFYLKNVSDNVYQCANVTSTPLSTVYRLKKRLDKENEITRKTGSGRKRKLDGRDRKVLGRIAQVDPLSSNKTIANRMETLVHVKVSRFTIGRELKRLNIKRYRPLIQPMLTQKHI